MPMPLTTGRTFPPSLFAGMNGTERDHAINLEAQKRAGKLAAWYFERFTFKLADDTRYTPDFCVIEPDGTVVFHETKGFWRDDAYVKIKVAADMFPFRFVAFEKVPKKGGGGWKSRVFVRQDELAPTPPTP